MDEVKPKMDEMAAWASNQWSAGVRYMRGHVVYYIGKYGESHRKAYDRNVKAYLGGLDYECIYPVVGFLAMCVFLLPPALLWVYCTPLPDKKKTGTGPPNRITTSNGPPAGSGEGAKAGKHGTPSATKAGETGRGFASDDKWSPVQAPKGSPVKVPSRDQLAGADGSTTGNRGTSVDVRGSTVKQLLKGRRMEAQAIQDKGKNANNRDRRRLKKLNVEIQLLVDTQLTPTGFAKKPDQLLAALTGNSEEAAEEEAEKGKESPGAKKRSKNQPEVTAPAKTPVNLIDLQKKFGLTMEQATAAALVMQMQEGIQLEEEPAKKKNKGGESLSKTEEDAGWAAVKKKW